MIRHTCTRKYTLDQLQRATKFADPPGFPTRVARHFDSAVSFLGERARMTVLEDALYDGLIAFGVPPGDIVHNADPLPGLSAKADLVVVSTGIAVHCMASARERWKIAERAALLYCLQADSIKETWVVTAREKPGQTDAQLREQNAAQESQCRVSGMRFTSIYDPDRMSELLAHCLGRG